MNSAFFLSALLPSIACCCNVSLRAYRFLFCLFDCLRSLHIRSPRRVIFMLRFRSCSIERHRLPPQRVVYVHLTVKNYELRWSDGISLVLFSPMMCISCAPIQKTIFFFCSCWAHKMSPNEYYRMHSESHRYQWLYSSCMQHALLFKCECCAPHNNVLIPSQLLLCRRVRQCHFVLFTTEFISFH